LGLSPQAVYGKARLRGLESRHFHRSVLAGGYGLIDARQASSMTKPDE